MRRFLSSAARLFGINELSHFSLAKRSNCRSMFFCFSRTWCLCFGFHSQRRIIGKTETQSIHANAFNPFAINRQNNVDKYIPSGDDGMKKKLPTMRKEYRSLSSHLSPPAIPFEYLISRELPRQVSGKFFHAPQLD